MSGRRSSATERAVDAYRAYPPSMKRTLTRRRHLAALLAQHHRIHKTTLYRALGFYRRKPNGHG